MSTEINYTYKKILGKQHTWNSKKWFEEKDGNLVNLQANNVWIDLIPSKPPKENNEIIEVLDKIELIEDKTVQNRLSYYVEINGERIDGFIPPSYGIDYTVKIFDNNGNKIPTTHKSAPLFDYVNGNLIFENEPPKGKIYLTIYRYIGRTIKHYLDNERSSITKGVMGFDEPNDDYIIQHNLNTFDIDVIIYSYDEINGEDYWKKDVLPLALIDENRVRVNLGEEKPIRFIIKSYEF